MPTGRKSNRNRYWQLWLHSLFDNAAAVATGVAAVMPLPDCLKRGAD
jgi:pyruvate/2-oxoacid:ferredoxin oxidoreductase beta subunit